MSEWKEFRLGDIALINMGQSPKSSSYNEDGSGMLFYQGVTEFKDKYIGKRLYTTSPLKVSSKGDILFSVRASVGRVNITLSDCCIGRGNASLSMNSLEIS